MAIDMLAPTWVRIRPAQRHGAVRIVNDELIGIRSPVKRFVRLVPIPRKIGRGYVLVVLVGIAAEVGRS